MLLWFDCLAAFWVDVLLNTLLGLLGVYCVLFVVCDLWLLILMTINIIRCYTFIDLVTGIISLLR